MLSQATIELFEWSCNRNVGSFSFTLYELISKADKENRVLIAKGFPEHVDCMNRYNNEPGYWTGLVTQLS